MSLRVGDRQLGWGQAPRPLERFCGHPPQAPEWFTGAQSLPVERLTFPVDGCDIELLCWGDAGKPGILLLHGSMAHARWWTAVAPLLALDYRVCSMSFSGMGGSGHRDSYSVAHMAREGRAALHAGGLFASGHPPIVACHSFGGKAGCLIAGGDGGERLAGVMFVDSFVVPDPVLGNPPPYRARHYASLEDAIARFRLSPDQPGGEPFVLDAIARAGVKQLADGRWTWCFDPDFFTKLHYENGWEQLKQARCPLAFIRGELSEIVSPADEALQRAQLRQDSIFVTIEGAHHHIMIDQPLRLVDAMRHIASNWFESAAA